MALSLNDVPLTITNADAVRSRKLWRIVFVVACSFISIFLDIFVYQGVDNYFDAAKLLVGFGLPWILPLIALIMPIGFGSTEQRSVVIDNSGVHTRNGRFHADYAWDQLKEARFHKSVVTVRGGNIIIYYIELIRSESPIQELLDGGNVIEDEYSGYRRAKLSEISDLINTGIAKWGKPAAVQSRL